MNKSRNVQLIVGDSAEKLKEVPDGSVNCVVTSPPYWGQREYDSKESIGLEADFDRYLENLMIIFDQVHRVLAADGSLWLNIGDKYHNKSLMGMPWRVALALKDRGWILRNDIIWNKVRMTQSARDRLRGLHEHVFHFVKNARYYYDRDAILIKHDSKPRRRNGRLVSITGTSGIRYREQIRTSGHLTADEKNNAIAALDGALNRMADGKIVDFRMTIRGQQRTSHGTSKRLSGRAKELDARGFYIMEQNSEGYMPTDLWSIVPEDTHRKDIHCAVFPAALLEIPIKATCPPGGMVLDPFVGTGTTAISALKHGKSCMGIDISSAYISRARQRVRDFEELGLEC